MAEPASAPPHPERRAPAPTGRTRSSPLAVPGYGPPPATRAYDGGPEPANYGIPPEAGPDEPDEDPPPADVDPPAAT